MSGINPILYFDYCSFFDFSIFKKIDTRKDSKSSRIFIKKFIKNKKKGVSMGNNKWLSSIV